MMLNLIENSSSKSSHGWSQLLLLNKTQHFVKILNWCGIFCWKKFQDFVCADIAVIEGFFPTSSRLNWNLKLTFIGSTKPTIILSLKLWTLNLAISTYLYTLCKLNEVHHACIEINVTEQISRYSLPLRLLTTRKPFIQVQDLNNNEHNFHKNSSLFYC